MRGIRCRSLRLELVAGLGIALAMPALAFGGQSAQGVATTTTLSAETRDQGGRTQATLSVTVLGADGQPASGMVAIQDLGKDLAGAALSASGHATFALNLAGGDHQLQALYVGDALHLASVSERTGVHALYTGTPSFTLTLSPTTLTLTAGQTGTVTATLTPENAAALTGPMFVTLSCSGNPNESSCTFTPENVEIAQGATAPVTSTMQFQTQVGSTASGVRPKRGNPVFLAIVLPGMVGLLGLAWGGRRRRWLSRVSLLGLIGMVTVLGTTGCNPRYYYLNHGPPLNPATPAGSYTVAVAAQSTNGVTAITQTATLALTVSQ